MQAVIETGGKQYLVAVNDKLVIEKLEGKAGDKIVFDKVLAKIDAESVTLGKPYLTNQHVEAKVIEQGKGEKLVIFKYRAKSRYRRKTGHRQQQTTVQIESIS